jgi:hypothetical protein
MQTANSPSRARFAFTLTLLLLSLGAPAWPGDEGPWARSSLKGVTAISVTVGDLASDAERDGLHKDQLQTDVELRLRQAGIKIVASTVPPDAISLANLVLMVDTLKLPQPPLYAVATTLTFRQLVNLVRDPGGVALAATWDTGNLSLRSAGRLRSVRQTVSDLVDKFINAYLEQNPKH